VSKPGPKKYGDKVDVNVDARVEQITEIKRTIIDPKVIEHIPSPASHMVPNLGIARAVMSR
jgi:hypothetical protein